MVSQIEQLKDERARLQAWVDEGKEFMERDEVKTEKEFCAAGKAKIKETKGMIMLIDWIIKVEKEGGNK